MTNAPKTALATGQQIASPLQSLIGGRILALREQRVMLDADLAELYGVQTKGAGNYKHASHSLTSLRASR